MSSMPLSVIMCINVVTSARWLQRVSGEGEGCWLMSGSSNPGGYPQIWLDGRLVKASRVALVAHLRRDLGSDMHASHKCHDAAVARGECVGGRCIHRRCVNPAHLVEETRLENLRAGGGSTALNAAKTECVHGHPLQESINGRRECRQCSRDRAERSAALIRSASQALGLTQRQYRSKYGSGHAAARDVLSLLDGTPQ